MAKDSAFIRYGYRNNSRILCGVCEITTKDGDLPMFRLIGGYYR